MPRYAYNVPRERFDDTLLEAARKAGAKIFEVPATVERVPGSDRVQLGCETLEATDGFFPQQPDLIVDATGRARLLQSCWKSRVAKAGERTPPCSRTWTARRSIMRPRAYTRLDHGWSWRIPLPGRVSVGMVIGSEHLPKFGPTKEERFDNLCARIPCCGQWRAAQNG